MGSVWGLRVSMGSVWGHYGVLGSVWGGYGAVQNMAVGKQNLEVMISNSNRSQQDFGTGGGGSEVTGQGLWGQGVAALPGLRSERAWPRYVGVASLWGYKATWAWPLRGGAWAGGGVAV